MRVARRDFLKASLELSTLAALAPAVPTFLVNTALAGAPRCGSGLTALVVIQLAGGNDGLNTVVPFRDDEYAKARPTLRLTRSAVHKINDDLGFHPKLEAFYRLYDQGLLTVVQGVGYPNPNQGHFESMRIWQAGDTDYRAAQTGWIGRAVDALLARYQGAMPAVFVGSIHKPFALNAQQAVIPTLRALADAAWQPAAQEACRLAAAARSPDSGPDQAPGAEQAQAGASEKDLLVFVRRTTLAAAQQSARVQSALQRQPPGHYPRFQLARQLFMIAQLLRAELGIRIFYTELGGEEPGGFDTHAGQAANHGALLQQLAESVAAFLDDLKRDGLLDRVLVMTFSEFGRTVEENGRRGTDHGSAAPLFLAGGQVCGGLVGSHPSLTERENGGQKHHTDFRRVYATVLEGWLGFDSQAVLGRNFAPLAILRTGRA